MGVMRFRRIARTARMQVERATMNMPMRAVTDGVKPLRHALILVIAVVVGAACPMARAAEPRLEFDPPVVSFGVLGRALDQDMSLEVKVRNVSDAPFDLRTAAIGCGCMSAEVLNPGLLEPDEAGTVRLTLNHRRVRPGKATYPLTVVDGPENVASVDVTYDYAPVVSADHFEFFIDSEQVALDGLVTPVRVRRPGHPSTPRVECDNKNFKVTLTPSAAADGTFELRVSCAGKVPPVGQIDATVSVYLAGSEEPDLKVPLLYRIPLPVTSRPGTVALKTLRSGAEVRRTVRLMSRGPFSIKSITSSNEAMTVVEQAGAGEKTGTVDGGFERTFELTIRPDVTGLFEAEVRLAVDGPVEFELSIPVVGEVVAGD